MEKIIITGANGLLGSEIWKVLVNKYKLFAAGKTKPEFVPENQWKELNILDYQEVYNTITKINPECVIHTAGISDPDECEKNPDLAYKFNTLATKNLVIATQRFDALFVYISTDYVFSGEKNSPYNEHDSPHPISVYGNTKLWGEEIVKDFLQRYFIIRTCMLFGSRRENFVTKTIKNLLQNKPVYAATDMVNNPTSAKDLANALAFLIPKPIYGTFHLTNDEYVSRFELVRFISDIVGTNNNNIIKTEQRKMDLISPRPKFSSLENFYWNLYNFPKMRSWKDAVREFVNLYRKS